MQSRIITHHDQVDSAISRTICSAIGERLRRDLCPVASDLPPPLIKLVEAMRRQETGSTADQVSR